MTGQLAFRFTQDEVDAEVYWRDREWKKFAVDVVHGPERKPTYAHTFYARARTPERAITCIKSQAGRIPRGARFSARLAGPRELGCVPAKEADAEVFRFARGDGRPA